jgi:4-amino-4-deoxy-L-arabinose transferase-like glycosyltransferase
MGRVGRIDMPLTGAVAAALGCVYLGYQARRGGRGSGRGWFLGAYVAVALAFLLKGPIGLVLPGLVVVAYLGCEREPVAPWQGRRWLRLANDLGLWWGLPLVLLLTLPWFVWAQARTDGEFFRVFFHYHNFQRGFGGAEALEPEPWWFYLVRFWVDLLPWSGLFPAVVVYLVRRGLWRQDPELRFAAVWLIAMFVLLSLVRFKRHDYLLPAYPGAAVLLGCVGEHWWRQASAHRRAWARAGLAGVVTTAVLGWLVYVDGLLPRWEARRAQQPLAAEIRRRVSTTGFVILFRTESHALVYHLGRPFDRIMEWENLDIWANRSFPVYVVTPPECAAEWSRHLKTGRLYHVFTAEDLSGVPHDEPLVVLCNRPVE